MARQLGFKRLIATVALAGTVVLGACQGDPAASVPPTPSAPSSRTGVADAPEFPEVVAPDKPLEAPSGVPEELKIVWEVYAYLTREHVDRSQIDPEKFSEAAIRGMLQALGDPHTGYVSPEAFDIENQDLQGRFEGIGANVSMRRDGKLVVVSPIKGSPAEQAGIRPGDVILEVNGESIAGLSLLEAVAKIRGPRGSTVRLLVQHLGAIDPVQIEVTRGVIPLESVLVRSEPGARIAHIRLTNFYADTPEILAETIQRARSEGAEGLIIDVRNNPGGLLKSVVDVTNLFLDAEQLKRQFQDKDVPSEMKGTPVVLFEVDGSGRQSNYRVGSTGIAADMPVVVIANEYSASASEILVGALQDYDRATVVGATTFGKGGVNILRELSNGGGLYLTFARWYTPAGRLIQGNGLAPDIEVVSRDPQQAEVAQLEKAVEVLESYLSARQSAGNAGG